MALVVMSSKELGRVGVLQVLEAGRIAATDAGLALGLGGRQVFRLLRAFRQARAAEREIMAGNYRGLLHGVPFALKDIYCTAGIRTTSHSRICADYVPTEDATTVTYQAGAVLPGKLATHEFAHGGPSFDLAWPPARNPWNREHFTGGSSSGAGAAIAAGFTPSAMGSDTGGSIRGPAALCGIVGLKPTYGWSAGRASMPIPSPSTMPAR
jgi:aspartyl-tRNA(Asn)/glutamyl-tRNA(Gln) amidotransferase subunit A